MKKKEIIKLLNYLNTYYNNKFELPNNKEKMKMMVETWNDFLGEYVYNSEVKTATKKLISEKEWPPTPGELAREIEKMKMPDDEKLSGQEAWGKVIELIRRYGVEYGYKQILRNISKNTIKALEAIGGLRVIGMSDENDTFLMNNFVKVYESIQERHRKDQMLPGNLKEEIKKTKKMELEKSTLLKEKNKNEKSMKELYDSGYK